MNIQRVKAGYEPPSRDFFPSFASWAPSLMALHRPADGSPCRARLVSSDGLRRSCVTDQPVQDARLLEAVLAQTMRGDA